MLELCTLQVNKADLKQARWHVQPAPELGAGDVLFNIDSFAFTSNNVTYAAFGDSMNYWGFFPSAAADEGIIPVWGFATVVQSKADGIEPGELFYGYFPFANRVVLHASKTSPNGFADLRPHRAELAAVYNSYNRCSADPFHAGSPQSVQSLLRPLYITSWLIDDFLADNGDFGATTVLLSSASSKTAYGTAFAMAQRGGQKPTVLGLTSAGNVAFCNSLGIYDQVLTYEQVTSLDAQTPCVYVDFAGNPGLRNSIHRHFAQLKHSAVIGGTHVTELVKHGGGKGLPGPKPVFFFAPAQIKKRASEWGGAELNRRLVQSWSAFASRVQQSTKGPAWLQVQSHSGQAPAMAAYHLVLQGSGDPRLGHVVSVG